jgi:hypothetical protein
VKHWREQKKVLAIDQCDFDRRIKRKFPFQFHGHREPGKPSAYNEYPLSCSVFHKSFLRPRSAQRLGSVHTNIRFLPMRASA